MAVTGADRCEKFTVHKDLACVRCPYFAEVFAAHQNTKILNINAEPDVFKLFMMFLYNHGYYYDPKHFPRSPAVRDGDGPQDRYMVLIRLFRLAEMLKVPALANKAVDQMQRFANEAEYLPKADTINFVYRITAPGSKLRKLMAELWSFRGDTERLAGLVNEEFFQFLMRRKSELIQNSIAQEKPLQALKLPNDRFYLLPYVRAPSPIPVESDDEDMFVNQNRGRQGRPRVPPSPASTATVERADF